MVDHRFPATVNRTLIVACVSISCRSLAKRWRRTSISRPERSSIDRCWWGRVRQRGWDKIRCRIDVGEGCLSWIDLVVSRCNGSVVLTAVGGQDIEVARRHRTSDQQVRARVAESLDTWLPDTLIFFFFFSLYLLFWSISSCPPRRFLILYRIKGHLDVGRGTNHQDEHQIRHFTIFPTRTQPLTPSQSSSQAQSQETPDRREANEICHSAREEVRGRDQGSEA